ncbi:MAG: adenine phosphoribosyltransferase [Pseudomonadota bacterium]
MDAIRSIIRTVPDFPKPGIQFRDITPLLADPKLMLRTVEALVQPFMDADISAVAGMEARGFIFGALAAQLLGAGFVPLRKPGKLPADVHRIDYDLEYGSASLELHRDAIAPGGRVLIVDDLLATGGTAAASCALIEAGGGQVSGCAFVVELDDLGGRDRLHPYRTHSLIRY